MEPLFTFRVLFLISCGRGIKEEGSISFKEGLQRHLNALTNKDIAKFEPAIHDNVVCILPDGDTSLTKSKFMEFHQNWFSNKNWELNYTILKINSTDDFGCACMQYQYIEKMMREGF